ncbi:MAG: MFS transporter [Chloroflexi bacterium]|nr:MFS transporter [Chloroflexota bacterium]MDA1174794.1 MFS transporter [Chloroflexota bacterium]
MSGRLVSRLARGRVYYGWYIVAVVLAGGIPRTGLNGSFFGIFLKPLAEEFGWTRAEVAMAVTIGTLMAAGMGFYLGRVLDKFGPRWMMAGGFAILAGSYFGLAFVNSLVAFYIVYSIGRAMMQSATGHTLMYALVSKWFVRRRATAISAATLGGYLGGILLAPLTQGIIDNFSWRHAYVFFGVLTILMAVIPAVVLLRRIPEDLGLLPDGDAGTAKDSEPSSSSASEAQAAPVAAQTATSERASLTLRDALHTPAFYMLTLMVMVTSVAMTGITFHMVPHFTDVGISNTAAATTISLLTVGSMVSVFGWGFLADRTSAKLMLMTALVLLEIGAALVANSTTEWGAYASSAIFGVGMAGYLVLSEVVWADFFGRKHLGSIRGVTMVFQLAGNASGSLIAAFMFDVSGSYDGAFKMILVLYAVSFTVLLIARRPKTPAGMLANNDVG